MVATVQRDPFAVLIRKVGYSVGLEHTRARLNDLVELYVRDRQVTTATWRTLVGETWGLKAPNIADVFGALNLISIHQGAVDILFGLDGLAISRLIGGVEAFPNAADAIFCVLLLAADADVFVNALAVDFDAEATRNVLLDMIASKRCLAYEAIRLSGLREKVDRVINIESQRTNRGSSASGKGVNLLTRTQPLGSGPGPLAGPSDATPSISDDYLRKVPPKRREWARSIGLYGEDGKTARGMQLLRLLENKGIRNGDGSFGMWPFEPELMALHLTPSSAPWPTITFEELCDIVEETFSPGCSRLPMMPYEMQIQKFAEAYSQYKELNLPKAALRGELPLRVARLFQLGWNVTADQRMSLSDILVDDRTSQDRKVETRSSRIHEGALIFRKSN